MDSSLLKHLSERNAELILHPASSVSALVNNGPQMMVSGDGCYVNDAEGKRLLDAIAGLWCVNVGYGRRQLSDAMKQAADQLAYYHTFANASNPWQVMLAEKLVTLAPTKLTKVFYGNSGSDANDTLVKVAWHYHSLRGKPLKTKIIAREQAYHGTSISTAGLTGLASFHKSYPLPLDFVLRTDCPHFYTRGQPGETEEAFCDRLIASVAALIEREGADTIAAFFAEPIQAAGGIIAPPKGYFPKLKALLQRHDILLVVDEVVCGFGRLGAWFGCELLEIEPDMLSSAKGLTSGYFPMSIAMMTQDIWQVLKQGSEELGAFYHGYTYSGHPVGCAVALANIALIEEENLVETARVNGLYLHQQLHAAFDEHPAVGEIRGLGMLAGLQLVADKAQRVLPSASAKWPLRVANAAREQGVIVRPLPTVGAIAMSPPLTFSQTQIDLLVKVLRRSVDELI